MNSETVRARDLLERLVRIPSVNPAMGGDGESEVARFLADVFRGAGIEVSLIEVLEGRPNVIATLPGAEDAGILLFEAHLDTVAPPPGGLPIRAEQDRLYGRGACDTKASGAAMVAAMLALVGERARRPTIVFAGVVDEETVMSGSRALIDQLARGLDGAVVGEPTSLHPIRAHNGLARFRVTARGRPAHTSKAYLGRNAVVDLAAFIVRVAEELIPRGEARPHPLTGPALLTPAVVAGGTAPNVVPDRAEVVFDRRVSPGQSVEEALTEVDDIMATCSQLGSDLVREEPFVDLPPVETPADHPMITVAEQATSAVLGNEIVAGGVPYGTDASNLSGRGGIPCVVLGPGSIDQAHTDDEWVSLDQVDAAVDVYVGITRLFAEQAAPAARRKGAS